jgi:hypothetical protein
LVREKKAAAIAVVAVAELFATDFEILVLAVAARLAF